ncbi:MAG: glycine cleavage system aminomethyltransferase GcvT [Acidobacteria bacterium]|nr:glycine cleavage system aminomethyltransferase GcvT [Acidobacteriota bacterium]
MKRTPLFSAHQELGARFIDFAGWEMPVQYESALQEHLVVRTHAGLFDVSHMGRIEIRGRNALSAVQKITCNDVNRLADGQAQYSALLFNEGTFVDDILVYRIDAEHLLICVNASNREKDYHWIVQHIGMEAEIRDFSDDYAQLALQGPLSQALLQKLVDVDLGQLKSYWFTFTKINGTRSMVSRTGYTGEDGFEIYPPSQEAEKIWKRLLATGTECELTPAGLAARNTLRLEARLALYGNDINETTTPWEAGLNWIVKLEKGEFIGKQALLRQKETGISRKLVGFEMVERGIARDHFPVYYRDRLVGHVTSGSFAPTLQKAIGLTYLPPAIANPGTEISIDIRGKRIKANVVPTPFYRRPVN